MNSPEDFAIEGKTFSLNSEVLLLANLIYDNNGLDYVDFLQKEHFYNPINGEIFQIIRLAIDKGGVADASYILSEMVSNAAINKALGYEEMGNILSKIIQKHDIFMPKHHADLIYKFYLKRRLMEIGQSAASILDLSPQGVQEKIQELEGDLYVLTDRADSGAERIDKQTKKLVKNLDVVRKNHKKIVGLESGFTDLDTLLSGFKKGDLIILAARPSMGKTALAVSMAYNIAKMFRDRKEESSVGVFSLEMSSEQIVARVASGHLGINSKVFETGMKTDDHGKYGAVSDQEFNEIVKKIYELDSLPLYIDSTPALDILALRSRIRKLKKKVNLGVVFVDYLQLLRGHYSNSSNRVQEISEITQTLKAVAREVGVPVIALSQLSRAVEQRDNKRPQLSDLRESGTIEQDADIVMFLFREAYYIERDRPEIPDEPGPEADEAMRAHYAAARRKAEVLQSKLAGIENLAELIVAKNRNGPIGNIGLAFERERVRFENRMNENVYSEENYNPFVKR